MRNMDYCRFHNILKDLQEAYDYWDEIVENDEEIKAQKSLLYLCQRIVKEKAC
jgi:hypothetical protein